ncbi:hypothetical protein NC652_040997 [Populus alba x Populus x berolinensis]|uniref:Uncharacterized protein n=1 Tax=Populus alba x Populus x berolinensis TaxID=444605 RepID=A0AAD6L7U8_9ROSI|nr:hypothetical protein NC652_040997 [Populus alba x Populus x berolinensis]KAJ6951944.1 hypothetical protein NC653_041191 [Populus alba x Populus x berolinensis]
MDMGKPKTKPASRRINTFPNTKTPCITCNILHNLPTWSTFHGQQFQCINKEKRTDESEPKAFEISTKSPKNSKPKPRQKERKRRLMSHAIIARQIETQKQSHLTLTAQFLVTSMEKEKRSAGKPGKRER